MIFPSTSIPPGLWHRIAIAVQKTVIDDPRPDTAGGASADDPAWITVSKTFQEYGLRPTQTLQVMQRARAYASGSTVLSSINKDTFPCGDLDLYCPPDGSAMLKDYLLESGERTLWKSVDLTEEEGDEGSEDGNGSDYLKMSGIAKIWYFRDEKGKEINVIVTATR
jgi:hypothetical protein